ncbi:hypothetical protein CRUP_001805, partial [Coryphaenoides rupestris]
MAGPNESTAPDRETADPPATAAPNVTRVDFYLHTASVAAVFAVSYLLIFLACMVGNGIVCFVVLRSRNMRTVTNVFILNLAISDMLVGLFCMPTTLIDNIVTGWPFGSVVCKFSGLVQGISKITIANSKRIIVVIWVLAVAIMCPSGLMLQVTKEPSVRIRAGGHRNTNNNNNNNNNSDDVVVDDSRPFYWCRENWPTQQMRKVYTTVLFASIFLAPLALIVRRQRGQRRGAPGGGRDDGAGRRRQSVSRGKKRAVKMLLVVALLFVVSWLPLWTLMMVSDYARLNARQHRLVNIYAYPLSHWLAFFNSSVNPLVYGFFNENFHRAFRAAFKLQLCSAVIERRRTFSLRLKGNHPPPPPPAVSP